MNALEQAVPKGYKSSEVGMIPESWNAVPAKEVVEFFGGYGFSSRLTSNSGTKWLKIANVGINEVKWDAVSYLPEYLAKSFREYSLEESDVVMALTRPLLGDQLKVAKLENKDLPALLNQRVAKLKPKNSNNLNYIYYSIQREDFIAAMNLAMAGTDPPNIGTNALGKIFVAIPEDDEEQTAIAKALSDVDALLTELENLIAKKQAIKTATMQQLLTGKTRLPQFATYTEGAVEGKNKGQPKGTKTSELGEIPEDWDVSPLQKLTVMMTNGFVGTAKDHYTDRDDGVLYIQGYNVLENNFKFRGIKKVTKEFHQRQSKSNLRTGDVLMVQTGDVGLTTIVPESLAGSNCHALIISRFKTKLFNPSYFSYYLNSQEGRARLKDIEIGTTMKHINVGDLLHFEVPVPSTIEEQTAIATILSDMDNEIQTLEQRLAKTRQIKQGMMQQLLTGRTRLPFNKE